MTAYLVVDVDDLIRRFRDHNMSVDLQELAVGLRGAAALAAGLVSAEKLSAIAVANWSSYQGGYAIDPKYIFRNAGYDVFDVPSRDALANALIVHYFSYDPDPVDELILVTTSPDLLPLIRRIKTTRNARIRVWGSDDVVAGTEFANEIIFQPLETLLGIQTKNVSVFIDFENIAISLNEQGYLVNLDRLIPSMVARAKHYGHLIRMAAYAPWGQRGALPPLVDSSGQEVADSAPTRLMMANIDPVFNLPGKNSADIRITKDVLTDSAQPNSADVYILASGDRDFNEVLNSLIQRGKVVIVWGVHGSTSRLLEQHPSLTVEYVEEFTNLETHQRLFAAREEPVYVEPFVPSQWSSVIIQLDRLTDAREIKVIPQNELLVRLLDSGAVVSIERGRELVEQAINQGILQRSGEMLKVNDENPTVEKTRTIRNCITRRVSNTLTVRGWGYVNYGFLLKGLEMERELMKPGMNLDDQWRSHWIDCLVREQILQRDLVPHRHNPDDLVPVIHIPDDSEAAKYAHQIAGGYSLVEDIDWVGMDPDALSEIDLDAGYMAKRIIVSVEQFTSFRSFAWCPLGSLHKRLKDYDNGMSFQRAVEYLVDNQVAIVDEYNNPQSNYFTKGIALYVEHPFAASVLYQRNEFIKTLLDLYEKNLPITSSHIRQARPDMEWDVELWLSTMVTENVLNQLPGRSGQYSLFRTHHTVKVVAGDKPSLE
ncbi:hypothetical protein MASR2M15_13200 [Anaerolineales bacterium]